MSHPAYSTKKYDENRPLSENNKNFITYHILDSVMKVGLNNKKRLFKYKKPDLCSDEKDIFDVDEEIEFFMTKNAFLLYIESIDGKDTKKLTKKWFLNFLKDLEKLLADLKEEIHKYD